MILDYDIDFCLSDADPYLILDSIGVYGYIIKCNWVVAFNYVILAI